MQELIKEKPFLGRAAAFLICNGATPDFDGFNFIIEAVAIWSDYERAVPPMLTKEVYPVIGKKYGRSWSTVERSIRHCIERIVSTEQGRSRCKSCLGYLPEDLKYRNSEFIALITAYAMGIGEAA